MRASVSCSQPVRSEFKSLLPNISAYITGRNSRNCADCTCCTRDNLPLPPLLRFFFFSHFYPCSTFPSLFHTSLCRLVQGRVASTSSLSRHCHRAKATFSNSFFQIWIYLRAISVLLFWHSFHRSVLFKDQCSFPAEAWEVGIEVSVTLEFECLEMFDVYS